MMVSFEECGHKVFRGTSPWSRGALKSKGGGKTTIHYNAEPQTAELLPRTIQGPEGHPSEIAWKLVAEVSDDEAPKVPSELVSCLTKNTTWNSKAHKNLVQQRDENFKNLPEDVQLTQISEDAGFTRSVSMGQFFVTNCAVKLEGYGVISSCREYTHPRDDERARPK